MEIEGLLGRKVGMTIYYREDGTVDPVTALEVGPCTVTQIRTAARDGYESVQLGFGAAAHLNKPRSGHLKRAGGKFRHLREFKAGDLAEFVVGQTVTAGVFRDGDTVSVTGVSRGRGFSGGVRRHGFRGGPKTHGQSDRHRAPGSIGAGSSPGRVWKGTRMAGQYGNARVTQRGLRVVRVDEERNLVFVRGGVPGARNSIIEIKLRKRAPEQGAAS